MLAAVTRKLYSWARYPLRQLFKIRPRVTGPLNTFRLLNDEKNKRNHFRRPFLGIRFRARSFSNLEVEAAGLKATNSRAHQGDFDKIDGHHFNHALSDSDSDVEFFSLDDISETESVVFERQGDNPLIPTRMVNMLGFINHKLETNTPGLAGHSEGN